MKCADVMTLNPGICVPEDKVTAAIEIMWNNDCGVVPVVKDLETRELIGIVTDRDIAMYVVRHACVHPYQAMVGDCMSSNICFCQQEDPLELVIQLMSEKQVRRIPIVDQDKACIGIVSQADLVLNAAGIEKYLVSMLQRVSTPWLQNQDLEIANCSEEEKKNDSTEEKTSDSKEEKSES